MKQKFFIIAGALLFLALGHGQEPAKKDKAENRIEHNAAGETVLTLDAEAQKRIGLKVEALAATTHVAETAAYGNVLDPAPLIALQGDLSTAEAAVAAAKKVFERAQKLFEGGENVARKTMESAEADLRANEIKLQTARRQLELEWGGGVAGMESEVRQKFLDQLVRAKTVLIRVDLSAGEVITNQPKSARLVALGQEQWIKGSVFSVAPRIDPKVQGEAFLLRVDNADPLLRPGLAVKAFLPNGGEARKGVIVPRAAVVRVEGKTWVYVNEAENKFTRRAVDLEDPLENGYFTASDLQPLQKIVVEAAQVLLSEEGKAQLTAD